MADGETVFEELSEAECNELLAGHHFGRLGVVADGAVSIFPVNYVFSDGRVAIKTDPGTKLSAAALGRVGFEIDEVNEASRSGWSVMISGTGYDVTDSIDTASEQVRQFPVDTWVPGERANWLRIEPTSITGRRIRPG
jgi:nitroimidazol reductase NimA-like FMN-containing flavoprotein (pyridoxamine 5'-phosphate oxidase superfamily)